MIPCSSGRTGWSSLSGATIIGSTFLQLYHTIILVNHVKMTDLLTMTPAKHQMVAPALPIRPRRLWLALVVFAFAVACFIIGFWPTANVKLTTNHQLTTSWVWVDRIMPEGSINGGQFEGYVRLPASRVFWVENNGAAHITFQLN